MTILTPPPLKEYSLLDSGDGYKLERFGDYVLQRPDPNAVWKPLHPELWEKADAIFHKEKKGGSHWENKNVREPWTFSHGKLKLELHLSPFKHTGLFPEQTANWEWFGELVGRRKGSIRILNLFGYTGGATLAAAAAGAQVTHVDASKPSITWARENQKLSGLAEAPIRWIVDDAKKFLQREIRRDSRYEGIIMDPPSFGRDPKGKVFKFEEQVPELIALAQQVLSDQPLFVLMNGYAMGFSPAVLHNMLADQFAYEEIESGELRLREENSSRQLPCSIFARWQKS
jgi:23S rRNA (cytosine1962-C5)-methyltransferase